MKTIEPLVADNPETKRSLFGAGLNVAYRRVGSWYDDFDECTSIVDPSFEQDDNGRFVLAESLRNLLKPFRSTINVPLSDGLSILFCFMPFRSLAEYHNNSELWRLNLARCVVALQLCADPDLPVSVIREHCRITDYAFERDKYNKHCLDLLFSYGLHYETYIFSFENHLRMLINCRRARNLPQERRQALLDEAKSELHYCLGKDADVERKDAFAEKYQLPRETLDVVADNRHFKAYEHLRGAYRAVLEGDYPEASDQYQKAADIFAELRLAEGIPDQIAEDYRMRESKSLEYKEECQARHQARRNGGLWGTIQYCLFSTVPAPSHSRASEYKKIR